MGGSWRVTGWNDNNQNLCSGAGGSNPIESSEPSISDPSRRVKGKENRELDIGGRVGSVGGVGKEGKNQCSIILSLPAPIFSLPPPFLYPFSTGNPQATPDMDPPPPFARAGHI